MSSLSSYMLHMDILCAVFVQLTPCEATFVYMTQLMLVCKTWKSAVKLTRIDVIWLKPYIDLCKSYSAALNTARNREVLDTFLYGMKAYRSCRTVQEKIMRFILMPNVASDAEKDRVRGAQIVSVAVEALIPHALFVVKRFPLSGDILQGFCRLVWALCKVDSEENSQTRTNAIIACGAVPIMVRGIQAHRNVFGPMADYNFVVALGRLGFNDNSVVTTIVEYIRPLTQGINIVRSVFMFINISVSAVNDDDSEYVLSTGVLPLIVRHAIAHIESQDIMRLACLILSSFATRHRSARKQIVAAGGVPMLLEMMNLHRTMQCTLESYGLVEAVLLDTPNIVLLHQVRIIERVARQLLEPTPIVLITARFSILTFSILLHSIRDSRRMKDALMHYEIMKVVERVMTLHRANFEVCKAVVLFLGELSSCNSFKRAGITTELWKLLLSEFGTWLRDTVVAASFMNFLASVIEGSSTNQQRKLVFDIGVESVLQVMAGNQSDVDIQRTGSRVLMNVLSMSTAESWETHCAFSNLRVIDLSLLALDTHKSDRLAITCIGTLAGLMGLPSLKDYIIDHGGIFFVIGVLDASQNPAVVFACLEFLSKLEAGDFNSHCTGRFLRGRSSEEKTQMLHYINNFPDIIAKSANCPGASAHVGVLASSVYTDILNSNK